MKKTILLVFLVWNIGNVEAQDYRKIDSLKKVLNTLPAMDGTEGDTIRMKISGDIGNLFMNSLYDSAKYWYSLITDTVFSKEKIKQTPNRSYYNASAFRNLGNMLYFQGDYPNATNCWKKSMTIFEVLVDKGGISKCINSLGIVFYYQGNYPKAIEYYEKSLKIKEEVGDHVGVSKCLTNMSIVFCVQGNYPKAVTYSEKSLKISEELNDKTGISNCLTNLGNVFYFQEDYPKALEYYIKALKIDEELGNKSSIALSLNNIGLVYKDQREYIKAKEYTERSLKIRREINDKRGIASCLINMGIVLYQQAYYDEAIEYINQSLKIKEGLCLYADLANDYPKLAAVFVKQKKYSEAAPFYLKAVQFKRKLIQDNFNILSEKEKEDFLKKTEEVFNSLNEFAFISKTDSVIKQCYDNELMLKGLLLNSSSNIMLEASISKDTIFSKSYWRLKQLRSKISELQSTPIDERKINLDSVEKLANEEESKLVKLSKDFANLQKQYTFKWQDVQKNLASNDIAIEFIRINYKLDRPVGVKTDSIGYAALILKQGMQHPEIINLCSELALLKMVGDLSWSDETLCKLIYKTNSKKGLRLYNFIWKPLEPFLVGVTNIYFAPVGVLNQISFAAIPTPDKKFLSDIFNLNLVSSTRILIEKENKKVIFEDAVIYGGLKYDWDSIYIKSLAQNNNLDEIRLLSDFKNSDTNKMDIKKWDYLPGTQLEASKINTLLKKKKIKTTFYSGYNGLEEIFKENKTSPSIIHIATHGFSFPSPAKGMEFTLFENSFVNNLNPLFRSGLLFAGANRTWSGAKPIEGIDDGVLTSYEVSNLNLSNTKLVVLSACETGLGDLKGNEGVYGLQRAFKMAGVKYIIMSLWQVPDAQTVELMKVFYKELLSGKDVRLAFSKAQNKMKLKYEPYYWAGFVLVE